MTRATRFVPLLLLLALPWLAGAQQYNGIMGGLDNLYRLSNAKSYSISPENLTGGKGKGAMAGEEGSAWQAARELGRGWKVNPYIRIQPGQTFTLGEITGEGNVQHIWMTPTGNWRLSILRIYWDDEKEPSVEVPVGDFFAMGWGVYAPLQSLAVCVNPGSAFNSYWPMPFHRKARFTLENLDDKQMTIYYQIDYTLGDVPDDAAYFHAQFRRVNPLPYKEVYTIVDGIKGKGHYVGTYMAYGTNSNGWWGEGEIKFYMDGDKDFPTIAGTGTEDYFNGSYNFDVARNYTTFTSPYSGLAQVIRPDGLYVSQQRFGMYRWHITDPVRFDADLRITIQSLGWRSNGTYLPQRDDIASVAYWYQTEPHAPFPKLPSRVNLEVN
jgi:hypothetical protein